MIILSMIISPWQFHIETFSYLAFPFNCHMEIKSFCPFKRHQHILKFNLSHITLNKRLILLKYFLWDWYDFISFLVQWFFLNHVLIGDDWILCYRMEVKMSSLRFYMIMEFCCDIDGFKELMKIYYILNSCLFDLHW
jgi:hypothetical protein